MIKSLFAHSCKCFRQISEATLCNISITALLWFYRLHVVLCSQQAFRLKHWQTERVASKETRNAQDPWIRWAMLHWKVVLAATLAALFFILIWEVVLKDLLSVTKWYPSPLNPCISCEWRVLCILPRGHQQMHPAAARSFLSALRPFCLKTLLQQS